MLSRVLYLLDHRDLVISFMNYTDSNDYTLYLLEHMQPWKNCLKFKITQKNLKIIPYKRLCLYGTLCILVNYSVSTLLVGIVPNQSKLTMSAALLPTFLTLFPLPLYSDHNAYKQASPKHFTRAPDFLQYSHGTYLSLMPAGLHVVSLKLLRKNFIWLFCLIFSLWIIEWCTS